MVFENEKKGIYMGLNTLNVIMPLIFLAYQILIDFVDMFPFNDIHSRDKRLRKYEVLGNYPPLLIISICFLIPSLVSHSVGLVLTLIIFIMHLLSWWIPYFFGFPAKVKSDYGRYFNRTYKFLPPIRDHIVPDAEHFGVGILLFILLIFQVISLFSY
jgi:hypothetical protein